MSNARRTRNYRRNRKWRYSRLIRNRSSVAQAGQIKALSTRINRVYRSIRPSTDVWYHDAVSQEFNNSALNSVYKTYDLGITSFKDHNGNAFAWNGARDYCKVINATVYGTIEYRDNYDSQNVAAGQQRTASIRILLLQRLQAGNSGIEYTKILNPVNSGSQYEIQTMSPLANGMSAYMRVLSDKTYFMSNQEPNKKLYINARKCLNLRQTTADSSFEQGCFCMYIITSGLHWDSNYTQRITLNWGMKIATQHD